MKISVIQHNPQECVRERSNDILKLRKNIDPTLHPFQRAREYTEALNAVKLERVFAKPFVAALAGHMDGVYCMAKHATNLTAMLSGSADGELRLWNLATKRCIWHTFGHSAFVRGVCFVPNNAEDLAFLSCADDKIIRLWSTADATKPAAEFDTSILYTSIDHHRTDDSFATAGGDAVQIWRHGRSAPVQTFAWGADSVRHVRFNPSEAAVFATTSSDSGIVLHDLRVSSPTAKLYLQMASNALAWNPMEPFYFSVANEDHNCYTFDMRRLDSACNVLKDHTSAVLDIDYSPTGNEIVTGSYDRSMRVFCSRSGHSRDVYHTKRMQRLFCVKYSMDSNYVLSGSDDGNIRLWKANAAQKLGVLAPRENASLQYAERLKRKFAHLPEIRRIARDRNVPKHIESVAKIKRIQQASQRTKEVNVRKHTKNPAPFVPERKKAVVRADC